MTLQEWRQHYRGVKVTSYPDDPEVFMVSSQLLPGGPLTDLHQLSDYTVTDENIQAHYGSTVWIAPKQVRAWTRQDYMNHRVSHHDYYLAVADAIGRNVIERLVHCIADRDRLRREVERDKHLNGIPLARWDGMHEAVVLAVQQRGSEVMAVSWSGQLLTPKTIYWSMSESVCVLKAVAREIAKEASAV